MRRLRARSASFSSGVQRLKTSISALVIFSIISWPMFFTNSSNVGACTKVMIW